MAFLRTSLKVILAVVLVAVAYEYFVNRRFKPAALSVEGFFHPHFKPVAELFKQQVESGMEPGGAFTVYHQGELVVDLRGGWADREAEREWSQDTLTMVYSVSKGVAAIVAAKMVDRGWLDYDKPVSHYWPEFQKHNITVAMLLSHQAGLVYLDTPVRLQQLVEERKVVEDILTSQQPAWPPGTAMGYHTFTFGLYVDTLLLKAHPQKKNVSQIFEEEIGIPFGIDFYFGLPKPQHHRAARMEVFSSIWDIANILLDPEKRAEVFLHLDSGSLLSKSLQVFGPNKHMRFNNPDIQSIGLSSNLGFTSARHLAKLYGILANGGTYKGRQLLKPETLARLQRVVMEGPDPVLGVSVKRSLGLFVDFHRQGVVGHHGFGGGLAYMDVGRKVGLGYVSNFLGPYPGLDPRVIALEEVTLRLVDSFQKK